jgi:hypothetical protein
MFLLAMVILIAVEGRAGFCAAENSKGWRIQYRQPLLLVPSGEYGSLASARFRGILFLVIGHEDLQVLDVHLAVAPAPPRTRR